MGAKRRKPRPQLFWSRCCLNVRPGIYTHQANDSGGETPRRLDDPSATHRMPNQHDLFQLKLFHHRHDILTEG
jgi:hypothetical protein